MIYVPQAEPIYMEVMIARTLIYKWLMWIIRLVKYIITPYICPNAPKCYKIGRIIWMSFDKQS